MRIPWSRYLWLSIAVWRVRGEEVNASVATTDVSASPLETTESVVTVIVAANASEPLSTVKDAVSVTGKSEQPSAEAEKNDEEDRMLSFEEWRKLNLKKSGQDDYTDRQPVVREAGYHGRQLTELENIGDDLEIDADMFSGGETEESNIETTAPKKDSGKFYKDRFNYASFDCAATVVKTNKEAKGAHHILIENKDSYMLNKCNAQDKFVIIELCQDILVDTVMVGTFEFFSSMFRDIRISASDRFPVPDKEWKVLGDFEGRNIRDLQSFHVKNPLIWARYVRIDFRSHWGQEFYCPVSLVRVHGTTMMEEYKSHGVKSGSSAEGVGEAVRNGTMETPRTNPYTDSISEQNATLADHEKEVEEDDDDDDDEEHSDTEEIVKKVVDPGVSEYSLDATCGIVMGNFSGIFLDSKPDFCQPISSKRKKPSTKPVPSKAPVPEQQEPTTQESIYQTIMKRIALLESNATLSMQYIESQTQTLLERLLRVDKKYELKIGAFLTNLNTSVIAQFRALDDHRRRISEMVETTFNSQEAHNVYEMSKMDERLQELADDLRYQKKVGIFQALILLVILGFVITTRGASVDASFFASSAAELAQKNQKFRKQHKRKQKSATSDEGFAGGSSISTPLFYSRASSPGLYHVRSLPSLRQAGEGSKPESATTPDSSKYEYDEIYYEPEESVMMRVRSNPTETNKIRFEEQQQPTPMVSRESSPLEDGI